MPALLDEEALARIRRIGGDALLTELLGIFIQQGGERVAETRTALAVGDLEAIRFASHSIGTSAGNLGAMNLHHLARDLEHAAVAGQTGNLTERVERFAAAFDAVSAEAQRHLESTA